MANILHELAIFIYEPTFFSGLFSEPFIQSLVQKPVYGA